MDGLNRVMLLGNVGREAEFFTTKNADKGICKFSVATTKSYKDGQGKWQQNTEWHNCVFFGEYAQDKAALLTKGRRVFVEGELRTSKYEKDGVTRYSTDIVVFNIKVQDSPVNSGRDPLDDESETEEEPPF